MMMVSGLFYIFAPLNYKSGTRSRRQQSAIFVPTHLGFNYRHSHVVVSGSGDAPGP